MDRSRRQFSLADFMGSELCGIVNRRLWWISPFLVLGACLLVYFLRQKDSPSGSERTREASTISGESAGTARPVGSNRGEDADPKERRKPSSRPVLPKRLKGDPYPVAVAVPGKAGFVISPYSGHAVDVLDVPPGTLVQDPMFPTEDKKYFRVPLDGVFQEGEAPAGKSNIGRVQPDENADEDADGK